MNTESVQKAGIQDILVIIIVQTILILSYLSKERDSLHMLMLKTPSMKSSRKQNS